MHTSCRERFEKSKRKPAWLNNSARKISKYKKARLKMLEWGSNMETRENRVLEGQI